MTRYGMANLETYVIHVADDLDGAVRLLNLAVEVGIRSALVVEIDGRWSHLAEGVKPIYAC